MKRHIVIITTLIISIITNLASCVNVLKNDGSDNIFIIGSPYACIYNNLLYYLDTSTSSIKYQRFDNIQDTGLPLFNDPLANPSENPFKNIMLGTAFMLIDTKNTENNNGFPILIIAYREISINGNGVVNNYKIVSFNTKNNKITVIKDKILESIQSLYLYNDYIFYTTNEGDLGYNIFRIDKDGKNIACLNNPKHELYRIQTIYGGRIYYVNGTGELFSSSLTFTDITYLFDIVLKAEVFIFNDYIYYCDDIAKKELNNIPFWYVDLYRVPLTDITAKEIILNDISVGMNCGDKYYFYYSNPRIIDSGNPDEGTDILYSLDLNSGDISTVYEKTGQQAQQYYIALSDRYIALTTYEPPVAVNGKVSSSVQSLSYIDLTTGEETYIPY